MTNKERLIALLGFTPPNDNSVIASLLELGLNASDEYNVANVNKIKKAAIEVMSILLSTADTGNGVVGWTAKYDRDAVIKRMNQLKSEVDSESTTPTIKGVTVW